MTPTPTPTISVQYIDSSADTGLGLYMGEWVQIDILFKIGLLFLVACILAVSFFKK